MVGVGVFSPKLQKPNREYLPKPPPHDGFGRGPKAVSLADVEGK